MGRQVWKLRDGRGRGKGRRIEGEKGRGRGEEEREEEVVVREKGKAGGLLHCIIHISYGWL